MRNCTIGASLSPSALGPRSSTLVPGFTLVELLIALALMGLITLLLFSGLRLGASAWEGVETVAERNAEPRIARNFLERVLTQARPAQVSYDAQELLVFAGDGQNLELVAPLSEHVGTPGLYVLRLGLEAENQLVLTRWLLHPDVLEGFGGIPEWEPFDGTAGISNTGPMEEDLAAGAYGRALLLDGVAELEISYFGVEDGVEEPDWYPEWLEQPRMPLAIRIHLTTLDQSWPHILIRLPQVDERPSPARSRAARSRSARSRSARPSQKASGAESP